MKMPRISVKTRIAAAALAAALAGATLATAGPAAADGVTPAQLTAAGWTCSRPHLAPMLLLYAPPGVDSRLHCVISPGLGCGANPRLHLWRLLRAGRQRCADVADLPGPAAPR